MNILREIAQGYTRYAERTGRLPTVLVLNPRDAARFETWLRWCVGDRTLTLLNREHVLGMRVVRGDQDGMLFLEEANLTLAPGLHLGGVVVQLPGGETDGHAPAPGALGTVPTPPC